MFGCTYVHLINLFRQNLLDERALIRGRRPDNRDFSRLSALFVTVTFYVMQSIF